MATYYQNPVPGPWSADGGLHTPRLIARGDLLGTLDRAATRKVTIISAPAGSGKTSLLRAWANQPDREHRIAFVSVRRDQEAAQQFWLALLNAVRHASGTTAETEPPTAAPDLNVPALVDRVLCELADPGSRITVVIDDLHELNAPEALAQLTRLLMNLPGDAHAMLATRHDLPLRLHRLRLVGELAEIRAADLRFTERETRKLLDASGIALSEAGAALLHQRTEGWAAGLRLAALSLAGHPDPERFVAEFSGSDRTIAEYLIAEMLERQPDDVQDLLLRTSLLDQVNGELADLLTGRPGSERILLSLEDANAFVVSLDPERTWFRYHHLFGNLLRLELRRTLPEQVPALHRRAAEWFVQHGHLADAIRHTQAAGDWPDAARMLADHAFSLTMDGQEQTVRALLRAFPRGADYPELALIRAGHNLSRGRLDESAAHLKVSEAYAETTPPDRQRRLRIAIASLKLSLARVVPARPDVTSVQRGQFREETSMPQTSASPLHDPAVHAVIERARTGRGAFPVAPEQGDLMYLICRATGATRVAEFATSLGVSTLYLTAAVRDNGGGIVIGSEIVAAKAEQARANLNEAGLAEFAEIRIGDARQTFADLGGPIDFLLVDGWPTDRGPTLARSVIELTAPQLRPGAIVVNDNGEEDYIAYVRDPANGFLSMPLPLKGSTELSIRR